MPAGTGGALSKPQGAACVTGMATTSGGTVRALRVRTVATAVVVLAVLLAACSDDGIERDADGTVTQSGSISVYDLQLGDCIEVPADVAEELEQVTVLPCDDPHTHEVYLVDDTTLDDTFEVYPGAPDVEGVASRICFDGFAEFVGSEVVDSDLTFTYLYPTLQSWTENDPVDRTIACLVVSAPTRGSVGGSAR